MLVRHASRPVSLVLGIVLAACSDGARPVAPNVANAGTQTPSLAFGPSQSTLLARASFSDPKDQVLKIKRITGDWHFEVKSMPAMDVAMQTIVFEKETESGWHSHPGPVFILVKSGEMTFYESDDPTCTPIRKKAGEGFLDMGDHAHIARNESGARAENVVTYFVPPGAPLRTPESNPGNCAF